MSGHVSIEEFLQDKSDAEKRAINEAVSFMDRAARYGAQLRAEGERESHLWWILAPIALAATGWAYGYSWLDAVTLIGTLVLGGCLLIFPLLCVRGFRRLFKMAGYHGQVQRMNKAAFHPYSARYAPHMQRVFVGLNKGVLDLSERRPPF
jgi:hypothetical protein